MNEQQAKETATDLLDHIEDFHTEIECFAHLVHALSMAYEGKDYLIGQELTRDTINSMRFYLERMTRTMRTATNKLLSLRNHLCGYDKAEEAE